MHVSIAEAKDRLAELIRAVEQGDQVIITRDDSKPVAQAVQPPPLKEHPHRDFRNQPPFDPTKK